MALRRSAGKNTLGEPGPSQADITQLLTVAARVPDHRRLEPWRFIVFSGEGRTAFGREIARIFATDTPDADAATIAIEAARFERAPVVIAVISSPDKTHKTPVWEQELSVGAVCQNLLLAANAAGWAGVWLSEWLAIHADIDKALGLSTHERVAGPPKDRAPILQQKLPTIPTTANRPVRTGPASARDSSAHRHPRCRRSVRAILQGYRAHADVRIYRAHRHHFHH